MTADLEKEVYEEAKALFVELCDKNGVARSLSVLGMASSLALGFIGYAAGDDAKELSLREFCNAITKTVRGEMPTALPNNSSSMTH